METQFHRVVSSQTHTENGFGLTRSLCLMVWHRIQRPKARFIASPTKKVAHLLRGLTLLCRQIRHRLDCNRLRRLCNQRVNHADLVICRFIVWMKRSRNVLLKVRVRLRFVLRERPLPRAFVVLIHIWVWSFIEVNVKWIRLLVLLPPSRFGRWSGVNWFHCTTGVADVGSCSSTSTDTSWPKFIDSSRESPGIPWVSSGCTGSETVVSRGTSKGTEESLFRRLLFSEALLSQKSTVLIALQLIQSFFQNSCEFTALQVNSALE
jgi:hypothetical protein